MSDTNQTGAVQKKFETSIVVMVLLITALVSVGGIVEIIPLFYLDETMEHNQHKEILWDRKEGQTLNDWQPGDGVRPYKPLELMGREFYIREGCYLCHSQMIRPFRDEKERYGHYSLASESIYDHPFQWGSKRTGPDLARVGGKYSDEWHVLHLLAPRSVVPESVMPNYPWLQKNHVDPDATTKTMQAMRTLGVPYTDADIASGAVEVEGKTELDALVAYLQVLGTMVKFDDSINYR
ncbi:Cytochrome c oxidase (cbb3-type) subunit CcoO [hydrothermal vent metagenome]|uniref:Cytochrome c oxidase (Cbb3-type) subunit CcoO n=1 Tax=hydrothermal vent metagenome TaxID=652676 RepID=A0A3B0XRF0_9ZZZZ